VDHSFNVDPKAYCKQFGHDYRRDEEKSLYYPNGYVVEKCANCGDLTLTYMAQGMAEFKQAYGENPLAFLAGK
jgi:hypothetical protein